ncbi:hypothetical protein BLNAU_6698 [Blattamonas nauphoetae]|uniref:PHD-type domain-containing protein n=1 Tax=Blattamonas nauphoetae TaxID=2049346 RepID=A0ABQ9Y3W0_9EUKA|nr:hypothetical protein BLNAU_6698 [Blattamonas nauphoetae]
MTTKKTRQSNARTYCICKQPYDVGQFMIQCDICNDWYHGKCVGITPEKAETMDSYYCEKCVGKNPSGNKRQPPAAAAAEAPAKSAKDVRKEVVSHFVPMLKKAIQKTVATLKEALSPKDGSTIDAAQKSTIEGQIAKLTAFEQSDEELLKRSTEIEQAMFDAYKTEKDKNYKQQYRSIKEMMGKQEQHAIRLSYLLGEKSSESLATTTEFK